MRTFRNLSYALLVLAVINLACLVAFTQAQESMVTFTLLGVFVAMFSMSVVAFLASLLLYFNAKNNNVVVLKRRGGRIYGELLLHKLRLITAMDGDKHVSDWNHYLYDADEFPRTKKLLGEEYFLLLSCDSFLPNSQAAKVYNAFRDLHDDLAAFMRSISYDRTDCAKFKKLYQISKGVEMTSSTPYEDFQSPEGLAESYEALQSANEQALNTVETLLNKIERLETAMDEHYDAGMRWTTTKKTFDARYQMWLNAQSI